jgi:hypothetical protein
MFATAPGRKHQIDSPMGARRLVVEHLNAPKHIEIKIPTGLRKESNDLAVEW